MVTRNLADAAANSCKSGSWAHSAIILNMETAKVSGHELERDGLDVQRESDRMLSKSTARLGHGVVEAVRRWRCSAQHLL